MIYQQVVAMLLVFLYQYKEIILGLGLIIADGPPKPKLYDRPLKNLTVQDVAAFYAANGVTIAMADDVYYFALQWLKDAITFCPSQAESLTSILTACQEAMSNLDLDCSIPMSMHSPPSRWDPSMLPHMESEPSQAGPSKPQSMTSSKDAAPSAASTSHIASVAPSTLMTDTKSSKTKGKAPVRASLTTSGPPTMLAPSLFASPPDMNRYTPLAESSAPSASSGLPVSRPLEQSCKGLNIYISLFTFNNYILE
jgi:hypothetical protein